MKQSFGLSSAFTEFFVLSDQTLSMGHHRRWWSVSLAGNCRDARRSDNQRTKGLGSTVDETVFRSQLGFCRILCAMRSDIVNRTPPSLVKRFSRRKLSRCSKKQ